MASRRWRWLAGLALVALLAGCGGTGRRRVVVLDRDTRDVIELAGDTRPAGRALPLRGDFWGALLGGEPGNELFLLVGDTGSVWATVTLAEGAPPLRLEGEIDGERRLRAEGDGCLVTGTFAGAAHPLDATVRFTSGVHFQGEWRLDGGGAGECEAWHGTWPPGYHVIFWDDYNPFEDILYDLAIGLW